MGWMSEMSEHGVPGMGEHGVPAGRGGLEHLKERCWSTWVRLPGRGCGVPERGWLQYLKEGGWSTWERGLSTLGEGVEYPGGGGGSGRGVGVLWEKREI